MSRQGVVLQDGLMSPVFNGRRTACRSLVFTVCISISAVLLIGAYAVGKAAQQNDKSGVANSTGQKNDQAAQPNATSSAHHFDRVVIIVLENGDYEAAVKDKNLADLAAHGASFSNFHALFHPSPNY